MEEFIWWYVGFDLRGSDEIGSCDGFKLIN
jgi:hypothetical protein